MKHAVAARFGAALLSILLICSCILSGCSKPADKAAGKEIGKWHAEVNLSDIDTSSLSDEDQAILALVAGNCLMEIDVEFSDDGTFTYVVNTDDLEEAVSGSVGNLVGLFISSNISSLINNFVSVLLKSSIDASSDMYGRYTVDDQGIITADSTSGTTLYFSVYGNNVLIQTDENGSELQKFNKQ